VLDPGFAAAQPATLRFTASEEYGALLPPGSIFIPAANDRAPTVYGASGLMPRLGFVPSAPDTLPIYEVQERIQKADNSYTIVVKNNGFYPWTNNIEPPNPDLWPVWIVPPPYEEYSSDSPPKPQYPNRNPIVAVSRRTARLREIP
jgi:hypothetical protein